MISRRRLARAVVGAAMAAGPSVSLGQVSGTWVGPQSGSWTVGTNWSTNPFYPTGGGSATLTSAVPGNTTIILNAPVTLSSLHFLGARRFSISPYLDDAIILTDSAIVNVATSPANLPQHVGARFEGPKLVKTGPGVLHLTGINTLLDQMTISGGTVLVATDNSLGSFGIVGSLILNGGAVATSSASITLNRDIVLTGGAGTLAAGLGTVTLLQPITGNGTMNLLNPNANAIQIQAPNDLSGGLNVHGAASLAGTSNFTGLTHLNIEGTLNLQTTTTATEGAIADGADVKLWGGVLNRTAGSATELLGNVTLAGGSCALVSTAGVYSLANLERQNRAILAVRNLSTAITGTPLTVIGSGAAGTPEVGIVPWVRRAFTAATPYTFQSGSLRALTAAEFITTIPTGVTGSNLKLSGAQVFNDPVTVNSLTFTGGGTITGLGPLTITSGGLFVDSILGPRSKIEIPLHFGTAEGIIQGATPTAGVHSNVWLTGPMEGSNGLTVAANVSMQGPRNYTGTTTVLGVPVALGGRDREPTGSAGCRLVARDIRCRWRHRRALELQNTRFIAVCPRYRGSKR